MLINSKTDCVIDPACESFLGKVLDPPTYGFAKDGKLVVPTHSELFREFRGNLNVFGPHGDWLALLSWTFTFLLVIPFILFFTTYFSVKLLFVGLVYSMVAMGTHGTIYLHRFCTHRAYTFRHPIYRFFVRNLTIKIIPEEVYAISHRVHHWKSEKPGDPYNVHGGWLYCFLSDANHQRIAQDLTEKEYGNLKKFLNHSGVKLNTYAQYKKYGSLCHPFRTVLHYVLNWSFWFGAFYLIGGPALAVAIFGMAAVWAFGVRTYNYDGHGGGKDKKVEGSDFLAENLAINQLWPGYVAGEWHNNHHLYPNGARSGFLPYQIDLAWLFIRFYRAIGGIKSYKDYRADFYRDHYNPYLVRTRVPESVPTNS
jgi:sn-1 stearoyl-lipid 9-desaturase